MDEGVAVEDVHKVDCNWKHLWILGITFPELGKRESVDVNINSQQLGLRLRLDAARGD